MPSITLDDSQLGPLKNKVVIITGGSSGIGLATVEKLLAHGTKVVVGDLNPPKASFDASAFTFQTCDVTSWASLVALFKTALEAHGHIDHVFANAGIAGYKKESYVNDVPVDPTTGDLLEPDHGVLAVNLIGVMNTVRLAIHHFRTQPAVTSPSPSSCSVVITASGAAFSRFGFSEYASSKHGVLGFARSLHDQLARADLTGTIRVNTVAPAFTDTAIINAEQVRSWGMAVQSPDVVALSAAWLMADQGCDQLVVYSHGGHYVEIEGDLLGASKLAVGDHISRPRQSSGTETHSNHVLDAQPGQDDTQV